MILVLVEGKAEISASGEAFGEMGERMSVLLRNCRRTVLYVPAESEVELRPHHRLRTGSLHGAGQARPQGAELSRKV